MWVTFVIFISIFIFCLLIYATEVVETVWKIGIVFFDQWFFSQENLVKLVIIVKMLFFRAMRSRNGPSSMVIGLSG